MAPSDQVVLIYLPKDGSATQTAFRSHSSVMTMVIKAYVVFHLRNGYQPHPICRQIDTLLHIQTLLPILIALLSAITLTARIFLAYAFGLFNPTKDEEERQHALVGERRGLGRLIAQSGGTVGFCFAIARAIACVVLVGLSVPLALHPPPGTVEGYHQILLLVHVRRSTITSFLMTDLLVGIYPFPCHSLNHCHLSTKTYHRALLRNPLRRAGRLHSQRRLAACHCRRRSCRYCRRVALMGQDICNRIRGCHHPSVQTASVPASGPTGTSHPTFAWFF